MSESMDTKALRKDAQRRLAAMSLKRCPLCGAVNALSNAECFVCRWYGDFEKDAVSVEEGLEELLDRCPELVDAVLERPLQQATILQKLGEFFARLRQSFSFRKDAIPGT